ncbi:hypothetical protein BDW42DRAFT_162290 [Aspergillus taichungensis]|uniref:Uncharacterized protein n=1 Tax=Aspergillus taichungensis TaxID=482145 RepID=A0A2J5I3W8_9EURO|nr:hypothetical protein BDW42DRAFT_162290 [Aspergillus taichungensis]
MAHGENGHPSNINPATNGTAEPSGVTRTPSPSARNSSVDKSPSPGNGVVGKDSNTTGPFGQTSWGKGTWHTANDPRGGEQANVTNGDLSFGTPSSRGTPSLFGSSGSSSFGLGSAGEGTAKTGEPVFSRPPGDRKIARPSSSFGGFGIPPGSGGFGTVGSGTPINRSASAVSPSLTHCTGSKGHRYYPLVEHDFSSSRRHTDCYHNICSRLPHSEFSFEEIRLADYQSGHRFATVS